MDSNNRQRTVFNSHLSKWIAGFYYVTLIFLIILTVTVPLIEVMSNLETFAFYGLFLIIILIIVFTISRAKNMEFVVTSDEIEISGLWRKKRLKLDSIETIEKTPIPFGFRLFGASFIGGKYYLPGIGRADVAMTNFQDGVLVKTKQHKNYVITPKEPYDFIAAVEERLKD